MMLRKMRNRCITMEGTEVRYGAMSLSVAMFTLHDRGVSKVTIQNTLKSVRTVCDQNPI